MIAAQSGQCAASAAAARVGAAAPARAIAGDRRQRRRRAARRRPRAWRAATRPGRRGRSRPRSPAPCGRRHGASATPSSSRRQVGEPRRASSAAPPAGRRSCASKPADTSTQLRRERVEHRQRDPPVDLVEVGVAGPGLERQVDGEAGPGAAPDLGRPRRCPGRTGTGGSTRTAPTDRRRTPPACRCRGGRRSRRSPRARARGPGVRRGDGDVVEQAEAHRPIGLGVMAGRAHAARSPARRPHRPAPRRPPPSPPRRPGGRPRTTRAACWCRRRASPPGRPWRRSRPMYAARVDARQLAVGRRAAVRRTAPPRWPQRAATARSTSARSGRSGWPGGVR